MLYEKYVKTIDLCFIPGFSMYFLSRLYINVRGMHYTMLFALGIGSGISLHIGVLSLVHGKWFLPVTALVCSL